MGRGDNLSLGQPLIGYNPNIVIEDFLLRFGHLLNVVLCGQLLILWLCHNTYIYYRIAQLKQVYKYCG